MVESVTAFLKKYKIGYILAFIGLGGIVDDLQTWIGWIKDASGWAYKMFALEIDENAIKWFFRFIGILGLLLVYLFSDTHKKIWCWLTKKQPIRNLYKENERFLNGIPIVNKNIQLGSLSNGQLYIDFTFQFFNGSGTDILLTSELKGSKGPIKYNNAELDLTLVVRDDGVLGSTIVSGDTFSIILRQYISIQISDEIRKRPDRTPTYFVRKVEFDFRNINIPVKIEDADTEDTQPRLNLGIEEFYYSLGSN